jgi:hypothetical protein
MVALEKAKALKNDDNVKTNMGFSALLMVTSRLHQSTSTQ